MAEHPRTFTINKDTRTNEILRQLTEGLEILILDKPSFRIGRNTVGYRIPVSHRAAGVNSMLPSSEVIPKSIRELTAIDCGDCSVLVSLRNLRKLVLMKSSSLKADVAIDLLSMVNLEHFQGGFSSWLRLSLPSRLQYYLQNVPVSQMHPIKYLQRQNSLEEIRTQKIELVSPSLLVEIICRENDYSSFPTMVLRRLQDVCPAMTLAVADVFRVSHYPQKELKAGITDSASSVYRESPDNFTYLFDHINPAHHFHLQEILCQPGLHPVYLGTNYELMVELGLMKIWLSNRTISLVEKALRMIPRTTEPSFVWHALLTCLSPSGEEFPSPSLSLAWALRTLQTCLTAKRIDFPVELLKILAGMMGADI